MGEFFFGKRLQKLTENKGKVLFYETCFEVGNTIQKPLFVPIVDNNKILTKKWVSLVFGKKYENCQKIKKNSYFTKPTSKSVISTGNHLFGPIIS